MEHHGTARLETEWLVLRRFAVEDAQDMFDNWASDPEVAKYVTWQPHLDVAVTRELLTLWSAQAEKIDTYNWCARSGSKKGGIFETATGWQTQKASAILFCFKSKKKDMF